jgi:hypothetical protein
VTWDFATSAGARFVWRKPGRLPSSPFTLVAVAKESCDVFVSRYNPKPRSFEPDPIEKMIYGTKAAPIKPPILITLFGNSPNRYPVQGETSEAGEWVPYSER